MPSSTSSTSARPPREPHIVPDDGAARRASLRIHGCTCLRVRRLARRITQVYDHALAPIGLRVTQFSLMSLLLQEDGSAIAPLADALDMDRTTLSRNLKPLVDAGLVDLSTNRDDARARVVRLTAAGRARHRDAVGRWRRAQEHVNGLVGHAEVVSLHRLFDDLIRTFQPERLTGAASTTPD